MAASRTGAAPTPKDLWIAWALPALWTGYEVASLLLSDPRTVEHVARGLAFAAGLAAWAWLVRRAIASGSTLAALAATAVIGFLGALASLDDGIVAPLAFGVTGIVGIFGLTVLRIRRSRKNT